EIAYVLKAFPRTSETFITNEIYLLETLGVSLSIFSVKRLDHQKLHGNVARIQAPITYLPVAEPVNGGPFWRWLLDSLPRLAASPSRPSSCTPTLTTSICEFFVYVILRPVECLVQNSPSRVPAPTSGIWKPFIGMSRLCTLSITVWIFRCSRRAPR